MKLYTRVVAVIMLVFGLTMTASAQDPPKASAHLWMDAFGGSEGAVLYPQYGWDARTKVGGLSGFGFLEVAPHEPLFTNHLVVWTPAKQGVFAVHTETGGLPNDTLGFFQIGPRLNIHQAIPKMKGTMAYMFVTALPEFVGIRTNNLLIAGGTNKFALASKVQFSVEGYRRFFDGPDYAEYWFLVHPKATGPFSFAVFVLHSGDRIDTSFGTRVSVF